MPDTTYSTFALETAVGGSGGVVKANEGATSATIPTASGLLVGAGVSLAAR